jgi:L-2,4-diaminobutyrate decarboxylase
MDHLDDLDHDTTTEAGEAFVRLVARYFASTREGEGAVSTARTPEDLAQRFDEPMPRRGRPLAEVVGRLERDVIADSNRLCHPRSLGHQVSAPLPAAVWTEALIGALNQSGAVWEMSPVGTVIEMLVIRWMCDLAGLGPAAGGTFTSGGTEATFAALLAARAAAMPDAWERGVSADGTAVVCGEHAHYGVARAVGELGLGTANIVVVPSRDHRLDVVALDQTLEALRADGRRVIAVVATSGTTATGSFDDLGTIGEICERYRVWLHVDAAHGGSALLSATHRPRVKGIERAQSIAWDPHKMMLLPLTASMLLVADEAALQAAYSQRAPYLFHRNGGGRAWDQGLRTFQCSRRLDAVKVWVALQRYGADQMAALYDRLCATACSLFEMVNARPEFVALNEPESNILCFRYVGEWAGRGFSLGDDERLDTLNQDLRERFNRSGEGWITTTMLDGRRVLRVTVMNPRTTDADLARVLDGLAAIGRALCR